MSNPLSNGIKAVLFDIGDTLVHFETSNVSKVLRESCQPAYDQILANGHQLPEYDTYLKVLRRFFLRDWLRSKVTRREVQLFNCLERVHQHLGADLSNDELDLVMRQTSIPAMKAITTDDPEAVAMLEFLRSKNLDLGIVSNTCFPASAIDAYLENAGLLEFFPVRIYSSDVRYMKPSRQIFKHALEAMNLDATDAMYVGDRLDNDVMGAGRVGMKTIHFSPNARKRHWLIKPDYHISSLSEIPAIVSG